MSPDHGVVPDRKRLRLAGYDYSCHGAYLVTVCVAGRRQLLGTIHGERVHLSPLGRLTSTCLRDVGRHHAGVRLDEHVVMPDHVHAIVLLPADRPDGRTLGVVVGTFKAAVSRRSRRRGLWQRGYHDRIIRDERELHALREYVAANPLRWSLPRRP
jgi:putative transposase